MTDKYRYQTMTCHKCGAKVKYNWYVRHVKSGCEKGATDDDNDNG